MQKKTAILAIIIIIALCIGFFSGLWVSPEVTGMRAQIQQLNTRLAEAAAATGKVSAQLDSVTKELSSEIAKYRKLEGDYKKLEKMVPPVVKVEPVTIDPKKTAFVIIDMQNDFLLVGGKLGPATKDEEKANMEYVRRIKTLLDKCRKAGMPIIYSQDYHYPGDPEFKIWPAHCEAGTPGAEMVAELAPKPGEYVIRKGGKTVSYDVFFASHKPGEMEETVKKLGVDTVIVTGTVSNICVYAAVVGFAQRGYKTIVPKDCIITLPFWPWGERFALFQFSALYKVVITESDKITFK